MDDGPRTGGLQALLLIVGGTCAYVTFGAGSYGAAPFMVAAFAALIWLEVYARRRAREDREERERQFRARSLRPLDWRGRPEMPGADADYDEGYDPFDVPGR